VGRIAVAKTARHLPAKQTSGRHLRNLGT